MTDAELYHLEGVVFVKGAPFATRSYIHHLYAELDRLQEERGKMEQYAAKNSCSDCIGLCHLLSCHTPPERIG
jgi:hypothetical protein